DRVLLAAKELKGPIGVQWYHWSQRDKDDWARYATGAGAFPVRVPAPEGFDDIVAEMQAQGAHVFPYVNIRLWNSDAAGYDQAKSRISRRADGIQHVSQWKQMQAAHICIHSDWWTDYLARVAEDVVREHGAHGLYLDQGGAAHFGGAYEYNT